MRPTLTHYPIFCFCLPVHALAKGPACLQQSGVISPALVTVVTSPPLSILVGLISILSSLASFLSKLLGGGTTTAPTPAPQEDCPFSFSRTDLNSDMNYSLARFDIGYHCPGRVKRFIESACPLCMLLFVCVLIQSDNYCSGFTAVVSNLAAHKRMMAHLSCLVLFSLANPLSTSLQIID
jgi:hypothetical protein